MSRTFEVEKLGLLYGSDKDQVVEVFVFEGDPRSIGAEAPEGSLALNPDGTAYQKTGGLDNSWTGGGPIGEIPNLLIASYLDRSAVEKSDEITIDKSEWREYISTPFTAAHNASYIIDASWTWALDSTSDDFETELLIDGVVQWSQSTEPKDKRNQRLLRHYKAKVDLTVGPHTLVLRFKPSKKKKDATMFHALVTMERFI